MARRRSRATTRTFVRGGRQKRIFIPQPVERPVRLHARDVLKGEVISPPVDWFTLHLRGPHREQIGLDQLEARAVPKEKVRGTLPERIMYKYLTDVVGWPEGGLWSFQSSLDGGRMELGGLVADFMIFHLRVILNPLGPTHDTFLRQAKDEENRQTYADFGYTQFEIPEAKVYDELYFEEWMRKVLGFATGARGSFTDDFSERLEGDPDVYETILHDLEGAHLVLSEL